jgi:hypothetical protein
MPKLVVTSAVVGGHEEAEYVAAVWRYSVDPWSNQLL